MAQGFTKLSWGLVGRMALLAIILLVSCQYFQIQFFHYPEPIPFSGDQFYNPYDSVGDGWLKANFHAHAHAWGGLTNGHQSGGQIQSAYRKMGYDLPYISDYFFINREQNRKDSSFMPIYEHGMNIHKSHRLAIGSGNVSFFDVMLFQNQDIRQYLIKRLKQTVPVVAINHPTMRNSHPVEMMPYLSGYDCLEVLNSFRVATKHWDAALSAGKPVWILGNDDCHDLRKTHKIGKSWTMVQTASANRASVLNALKVGKTYGVQRRHDQISRRELLNNQWRKKTDNILRYIKVQQDTLRVRLAQTVDTIRVIGPGGKILKYQAFSDTLAYPIQLSDAYVRVEAQTPKLAYYFNPLVRYDGQTVPQNTLQARVKFWPTFLLRLGIIYGNLLLLVWLFHPYFSVWLRPVASTSAPAFNIQAK